MKNESFHGKIESFPDGWVYSKVPKEKSDSIRQHSKRGNVPITAKLGDSEWPTLLWGFGDGTFFITVPAKVRKKENVSVGDNFNISFAVR